ncbi:hypothetical protein NEFER03_0364 [Nematocida sp. LUAm3]|nr:hypothetical protein NEFER03_0364 [Nematocida sp. LUAm3]KAI5176020.1 hypothetical protein NEFER02_1866 [Nematocida sp. LUAm2]KAI5179117.1 hypothetical protein NEFER01_1984 [Nematocida sp. LUAm1]
MLKIRAFGVVCFFSILNRLNGCNKEKESKYTYRESVSNEYPISTIRMGESFYIDMDERMTKCFCKEIAINFFEKLQSTLDMLLKKKSMDSVDGVYIDFNFEIISKAIIKMKYKKSENFYYYIDESPFYNSEANGMGECGDESSADKEELSKCTNKASLFKNRISRVFSRITPSKSDTKALPLNSSETALKESNANTKIEKGRRKVNTQKRDNPQQSMQKAEVRWNFSNEHNNEDAKKKLLRLNNSKHKLSKITKSESESAKSRQTCTKRAHGNMLKRNSLQYDALSYDMPTNPRPRYDTPKNARLQYIQFGHDRLSSFYGYEIPRHLLVENAMTSNPKHVGEGEHMPESKVGEDTVDIKEKGQKEEELDKEKVQKEGETLMENNAISPLLETHSSAPMVEKTTSDSAPKKTSDMSMPQSIPNTSATINTSNTPIDQTINENKL